jgi:integrase
VPVIRFHDLRHTAATLLLEQGIDVATASRILGHSTIMTTVDRYGLLTTRSTGPALVRLASLLSG